MDSENESSDGDGDDTIPSGKDCIKNCTDPEKDIPSALKCDRGLLEISSDSDDEREHWQHNTAGFVIDRTSNSVSVSEDQQKTDQEKQSGESKSLKKKRRRRKKNKDKEMAKEAVDP